jgi:XRE family transcriptional regulator, regulator of sulfur utilization
MGTPMKTFLCLLMSVILSSKLMAQTDSSAPAQPAKLASAVYDWEKLPVTTLTNGMRRAVLDGPTATVDKLHCHITTLNPGQVSSEPHLHLQEELIIIKEGTIEAYFDGQKQTAGPGSVIHFAAHAVTALRNAGKTPATYTVVYFLTPQTPKS